MRLKSLKLTNFKGIRDLTFEPDGHDATISGQNATGKTTVADSFFWLLFSKDSLNRSDFEIKPLSDSGEAEHGLEHIVEATLEIDYPTDHGVESQGLVLKKVLTEKWVKPRGKAEHIFSGHEIHHYLEGVPVKEREYKDRIAEIAPEQIFRLLTNPRYFSESKDFDWQKRRKLLLEICADVSDSDVVASNPKLSTLPEILGKHTLENYRKILASRRTEINGKLSDIPVRISEQSRVIVDAGVQPGPVREKIAELEKSVAGYRTQLATLESGGAITEKKQQLAELATQIIEAANLERRKVSNSIHAKTQDLQRAQSSLDILVKDRKKALEEIETSQAKIADYESDMAKLRAKWGEVNALEFKESDTLCPTCGQSLPIDKTDELREKFNLEKAETLKDIVSKGKTLKTFCDRLTAVIDDLSRKMPDLEAKTIVAHGAIKTIQRELADLEVEKTKPIYAEIGGPIVKQKMDLEREIAAIQANRQGAVDEIKGKIEALEAETNSFRAALVQIAGNKTANERIAELKREERQLAVELEKLESELFLTEEFTRAKCSMLDEKINSRFQIARFKLFNQLVNGGVEDCCEILVNGVPYNSLNNAMRINAGIEIANILSTHYGVTAPQFLDNCEAVNNILPSICQQIKLYVTDDKTLKIELEEENERRENSIAA